ncbi:MAG: cation acetate symporter, partial [Spirochaetes bacterium]|nr:cation acetate symporter [Spirochaetota bacterium]
MIYSISPLAIGLFMAIVVAVLAISVYFARKSSSSTNYFAAGGTIPWQVNGIAFAGDYLSAASFLGICGMIAFSGYDGFLYSIGYLAGWIVALFVIAEPIKRLGKYTFADALDAIFKFPGIRLMAGISTLVVSIFYLIPQMVGAGSLVVPLLGLPHWIGVIGVGSIVIFIVATAGMKSTTYVQFIKGSLLIVFSLILTFAILNKGLSTKPSAEYHQFESLEATISGDLISGLPAGYSATDTHATATGLFVRTEKAGTIRWWKASSDNGPVTLAETLTITTSADGSILYNGAPREEQAFYQVGHLDQIVVDGQDVDSTGRLNPISYLSILNQSRVMLFSEVKFSAGGEQVRLW